MKPQEFDKLTSQILAPEMIAAGFKADQWIFSRCLPDGLCHLVTMDFDIRNKKSFRVIVGFDSTILNDIGTSPGQSGTIGVHYVTGGGLSKRPSSFPAFDDGSARRSLGQVVSAMQQHVFPWFTEFNSLERAIPIIEEEFPYIKAKLLFSLGRHADSLPYLDRHLAYLSTLEPSADVLQGKRETEEMRRLCRHAESLDSE
jgi:hypothetical protein